MNLFTGNCLWPVLNMCSVNARTKAIDVNRIDLSIDDVVHLFTCIEICFETVSRPEYKEKRYNCQEASFKNLLNPLVLAILVSYP